MFYAYGHHLVLHSFPTRRSSDLGADDLMEALRRSVEQAKHDRDSVAPARRPARKRPAKQATKSAAAPQPTSVRKDRKSTRLNSSHPSISYAVFCLKKKIGILHEL